MSSWGQRMPARHHASQGQLTEEASSGVEPGRSQDAGRRRLSWGMMLIKQWRKRKRFREPAPQGPSRVDNLSLLSAIQRGSWGEDTPSRLTEGCLHPGRALWCPSLLRWWSLVHMGHHSPGEGPFLWVPVNGKRPPLDGTATFSSSHLPHPDRSMRGQGTVI